MNAYKSYSSQGLAEEIQNNDHFSLDLIQECFNRGSLSLNQVIEKKAQENEELREIVRSLHNLPLKGFVVFYPNEDRIELVDISEIAIFQISDRMKNKLKSVSDDPDFYVKLSVEQVPGKMFQYQAHEKANSERSFISSAHIGSAITIATAAAAAILFFQGDVTERAEASVPRLSQHQEFISGYDAVMHDLRKGGMKLNPANDLKEADLRLISSIIEDEDESVPDLVPMTEEDIIAGIQSEISPYISDQNKINKIAKAIYEASSEREVDYMLFLSIMKVETTTFNQDAVSSSGDLSIAQIKPEVWTAEFERLGKEPLDKKRLKADPSYAIERMGEILEIQNKYKKKDPYWYARYHSKTPSRKLKYAKKVQQEYLRIKERQIEELENKISNLLVDLEKVEGTEFDSALSFARNALMDKEKIDDYKVELRKIQKLIQENKMQKMKDSVASL